MGPKSNDAFVRREEDLERHTWRGKDNMKVKVEEMSDLVEAAKE